MTFRAKLIAAFGAALTILIAVGVLSYRRVLQEDQDQLWVSHTHQVLEKLDAVLTDLVDAETGQRGYVITGNDFYLEPYRFVLGRVQSDRDELRGLISDNPSQVRSLDLLDPLIASKLAELERTISIRRRSGLAAGIAQVHTDMGKKIMDQIRAQLGLMKQREQQLLALRLKATAASSRNAKIVILSGNILAFFFLLVAGVIINHEIANRRRVESELRLSEERYRLLFDCNPQPVWVYDLDTLAILDANQSAIQNYGYPREEFASLTIKDLRPAEDVAELLEDVVKSADVPEQHGAWRHRKKDGSIIDVEVVSHPLIYKGKHARLVVATDISERRRAEMALRQSEERFRLMVSNVKDYAIVMLDPSGAVISWNEGAERIKGYQADEIIGKHFSRFYPQEDRDGGKPALELKTAAEQGRFEDESWRVRKDGSRFWANVIVTALRDETGQLRGFSKITRDITERKQAEEALEVQRKRLARSNTELEAANKELEAFCYSVSHDLRAPLRGIDGFSQALLEDYAPQLDPQAKDYLQRVRSGTQRMGTLIDDLLNLSRITRAEMRRESVNLTELARSVAAELRQNQPERQVEFVIAPGFHTIGDSRLIRIVLENLLGNAWKFSSRRDHARIELGNAQNNGTSAFFVRDNGAGFDPAYADRLFGAFQRLHAASEFPGTGVGLATVQRIIHRHGGKVWAESALDRGATFYFTL